MALNVNMKFVLPVVATVLSGCAVGPNYVRPDIKAPTSWKASEKDRATLWPQAEWWKNFSDPELERLVDAVLKNNYDIKSAISRIDQARALAKVAGSGLFPSDDAESGTSRDQRSSTIARGGRVRTSNLYTMQMITSYELDIWGKNRMTAKAAKARVESSIYDWQGVRLALTAETATTYFQLLALNDRLEVARKITEAQRGIMDIIEKRYRTGMVSGLDLAQAKANLASVEATISAIEQQRKQILNAIAVLAGENPGDIEIKSNFLMHAVIPVSIPEGMPSGLLERRPDIKEAEAELIAANADMRVAKAALFPSITLTAQGGYASQNLSSLINPASTLYSLGANIVATIFQGYRLSGEYERTKARYQELIYNYRKAMISAFSDVENALIAVKKLDEQEILSTEAVDHAQKAYNISGVQYKNGLVDYTTVLQTEAALLNNRNTQILTRLNRLIALTGLYKALGGGFEGKI